MERLKFPKLKITFDTEYTTQPISIKFNNIVTELPQGKFFIEYQIQSIEDKVAIEFLNFTLWSQHLILHTRESLRKILEGTGFKNVIIKGIIILKEYDQ